MRVTANLLTVATCDYAEWDGSELDHYDCRFVGERAQLQGFRQQPGAVARRLGAHQLL